MSLSGKLCVGILEEDNPLKSYFRFKPLLVEEDGAYRSFCSTEVFPESGCLRIVPDKNESGHFKARMRRIGRYALLDLRAHPGENDKIRPNKNYQASPEESNAYIVYSDVVVEPRPGMLYEVVDRTAPDGSTHMALTMPLPGTSRVLFRGESGVAPALWRATPMEGVDGAVELSREDALVHLENGSAVRLGGFAGEETLVYLAAPGMALTDAVEPQQAAPAAEKPAAEKPAEPREPARTRMSARAQAIALQTGLNPRRSRSLQEIIDDKWRRSRIDQLGHPVPGEATGIPVESPVERAMEALRAAWSVEKTRPQLADAVCEFAELNSAVQERAQTRADETNARRLNDLEAQRLRLLDEIGALEARRADARERLLEQVRSENARALSDGERQLSALRAQIAACEERAQGARDATAEAESAYADAQKRLASRAAENSALRFLRAPAVQVRVSHAQPSAGELLSDVRARMAAAGFPVSHDRAVELLAALTLCPVTILCGGAFAPKGEVVRALGESLGLGQRLLALACVRRQEPMVDALLEDASGLAPALIWMENCNAPERAPHAEALRLRINALAPEHPARLVLTASDDGLCLPVELLDGAFLLRLEPESASSPWHEAPASFAPPEGAISMEALRSVFRPCPEAVTEEAIARMARLRQALGERGVLLSRRTLNAVWSLCAAIAPLLSERSPMRALDIALARRALPAVLAAAPMEALNALPEMVTDLEECQKLLQSPLPIF